ncbi:LysM-domain-containing protein [Marssonina coronariae]|uniref:LysM-domain-containing protein n=1 Tax=Diplocarpon coronariae TaxID=2795749 RepID=A0A218Z0T8_9HELO|nr:LysM-domain-containing protein [Marssonina coronariae]
MSRWNADDDDSRRLPSGMRRTGYDADTQTYSYRDADGGTWEGAPGGQGPRAATAADVSSFIPNPNPNPNPAPKSTQGEPPGCERDGEGECTQANTPSITQYHSLDESERAAWRSLLPFCLLVLVVLAVLARYLSRSAAAPALFCPRGSERYVVRTGDSCWRIAQESGGSVEDLVMRNTGLRCDLLLVGTQICVLGR